MSNGSNRAQSSIPGPPLFFAVLLPVLTVITGAVVSFTSLESTTSLLSYVLRWPTGLLESSSSFSSSYVTVHDARNDIRYRGISTEASSTEHFRNIFYAEDTAGQNRFIPAVPYLAPRGSTVDATSYGAWCAQAMAEVAPLPFASPIVNVSENCLSLSVSRPAGTKPDDGLPVIVWVHGGGHALGSHADKLYKPDGLVRQAQLSGTPVIVVGINYRVGIFGFAATKALKDAGHMNLGLRDQRTAFEWVKDNIEVFGGNPGRVTALGHSVGAGDIALHLLSYGGKRDVPFQKAMMMSGASGLNVGFSSKHYIDRTASIAKELGCANDNDTQSGNAIRCMQDLPMEALVNASASLSKQSKPPFGEYFFDPSLDGDYIPDVPSKLLRQGRFAKGIPIVSSWMTNDGAWYAPATTRDDTDVNAAVTTWTGNISASTMSALLSLYPASDFESMVLPGEGVSAQYFRAAEILRDVLFVCPIIDFTWHYARAGGDGDGGGTSIVGLYETNSTRFTPVYGAMGTPFWRAVHLSDVVYVFGNEFMDGGIDNSPTQREITASFARGVAAYAGSEVPIQEGDANGLLQWSLPAYSGNNADELGNELPSKVAFKLNNGSSNVTNVSLQREANSRKKGMERLVHWRRLIERCDFINSPKMREEIGV